MRQPNLTAMPRPAQRPDQSIVEPVRRAPVLPLPRSRGRTARRLAVLTFQEVTDPASFRAQMERLQRNANPVAPAAVEAALAGGAPLPPHATLVSFELGHRSVVDVALPVLTALGIPAVAFVVAGLVDTECPYWWQEAEFLLDQGGRARGLSERTPGGVTAALSALPDPDRRRSLQELRVTARRQAPGCAQLTSTDLLELRSGGVAVGNHTLGHTRLDSCDDYALREEVVGGHERLARLSGGQPTAFAYPDGGFDRRAESLLRELGYRSAFLSDGALFDLRGPRGGAAGSAGGSGSAGDGDSQRPDPLRISRLNVNAGTARGLFDGVLSGWTPSTRRLRGEVAV